MKFSEIIAMTHGITQAHLLRAYDVYKTAVSINPVIVSLTITDAYMYPITNVTLSNGLVLKGVLEVKGETRLDSPDTNVGDGSPSVTCSNVASVPRGEYHFVSDAISAIDAVVNVICYPYPVLTCTGDDYEIGDHHVFPLIAKAMSIVTMELGDIVGSGAQEKFYINIINFMNMNRVKPGNTGLSYMEDSHDVL